MTQIPLSDQELLAQAKRVLATEAAAVAGASEQLEALPALARLLASCEGHILVTGVGTSAAIARRLAHLLSCCGAPALPFEASDGLHGGSGAITARDVLVVISKGGKSAEINRLVEIAKGRGARIVALTETAESPLAPLCDALLIVRAPAEVDALGGLVALGSSLVNAAVGDALCTAILALKGYSLEEFARTHPGGAVGEKLSHLHAPQGGTE